MTVEHKGQKFMTDDDLRVYEFSAIPRRDIENLELRKIFQEEYDRTFLGGDEFISYIQSLVSSGMDFNSLEEEILSDIKNPDKPPLKEIIFNKTATGIGRGHSLGGLSVVSIGLTGTKMLDSGLTGLVASRSLATSSRRRETTTEEIVIPKNLMGREDLLEEYLEISRDVFGVSKGFKSKFGKLGGVETFNKVIPYNNPANIDMVFPLDTLATLAFELNQDSLNLNGNFVPRELETLGEIFLGLTEEMGMNVMYKQKVNIPRDTYLHYTVFKDPLLPNYALEHAKLKEMPLYPLVLDVSKDFTRGFWRGFENLEALFEKAKKTNDPEELATMSMDNMLALRSFTNDYNEAVRVKILDSLSWRVWSEQKRHATLRQNVESVYSAADRAYGIIKKIWPEIKKANNGGDWEYLVDEAEKAVIIDDRLKKNRDLLVPYLYHTARQLMFYGKLLDEGFEARDALYIVPKNIRVRTLENYDLINLINLELPLRLCSTCEPERNASSWKKREIIADVVPELKYFLEPKCNVGYCTEGRPCEHINRLRGGDYDMELHKAVKQIILDRAR